MMPARFRNALDDLARQHGVKPSDILSPQRRYKHLRWQLWAQFYTPVTGAYTLGQLGRMTGFDHTSVRYGIFRHLGYGPHDIPTGDLVLPGLVRSARAEVAP